MNTNYTINIAKQEIILLPYIYAISIIILCTLINFILAPYIEIHNLMMIYLVGIVINAILYAKQKFLSAFTACSSMLLYNFFFTEPYYSFYVNKKSDTVTILIFLIIAQLVNILSTHLQKYTQAAEKAKMEAQNESGRNILLLSISHDLRTPLTSIMGSAGSLLQDKNQLSDSIRYELIQTIYDESQRLTRLINNVLQIIRIESSAIKIIKELHLIEEIIGSALNQVDPILKDRKIIVNVKQPMPLTPLDPLLIQQVLINLIENAVKFTNNNSVIKINSEYKTKHLFVSVSDEGIGIASEELQLIFNKFHKANHSEGIGLGLAFCKEAIEAHGGKIWAENGKPNGAVFIFSIPGR